MLFFWQMDLDLIC